MSTGRTKVAMIGAGFIADIHLESYHRFVPEAEVTAIWSRSAARAEALAQRYGIPRWFTNVDELLASADYDVVDICSPNHQHAAVAIEQGDADIGAIGFVRHGRCHSEARVSANPESRDSGFMLRMPRNDGVEGE